MSVDEREALFFGILAIGYGIVCILAAIFKWHELLDGPLERHFDLAEKTWYRLLVSIIGIAAIIAGTWLLAQ